MTVYLEKDGWVLDEASTQELLEAIAEADRGELVSAEEVFAGLPPRGGDEHSPNRPGS